MFIFDFVLNVIDAEAHAVHTVESQNIRPILTNILVFGELPCVKSSLRDHYFARLDLVSSVCFFDDTMTLLYDTMTR